MGSFRPFFDEMRSIEIESSNVVYCRRCRSKNAVRCWIFEDILVVIHFFAAVQKSNSSELLMFGRPISVLLVVAMAARQKQVFVMMPVTSPDCRIEVVDLHKHFAPASPTLVLH